MDRDNNWSDLVIKVIVALIILAILGMCAAQEKAEWEEFSKKHDCKVTGFRKGAWTMDSNMDLTRQPDERSYLCDDGMTYWRPV